MTKTTNYDLNIIESSDIFGFSVINENTETIDEELKKIHDSLGDISDLDIGDVDSIVEALNSVFRSGSEKKANLVANLTAMGITCTTDDSWEVLLGYVLNIVTGVDCSNCTASASDILSGKTAGVGTNVITGTISSKAAATYTPGDSIQTITAGQYLRGDQTISAVPTETKTVTAGTSAMTINRTTGKYIKSITINPTPSHEKTITASTSQQVVTPDSGKLLSKVTVNAFSGKKYASGRQTQFSGSNLAFYVASVTSVGTTANSTYMTRSFDLGIGWTPSFVRLKIYRSNDTLMYTVYLNQGKRQELLENSSGTTVYAIGYSTTTSTYKLLDGTQVTVCVLNDSDNVTAIEWEAWE